MRKYIFLASIMLSGCGFESRSNETIGQVKKIVHQIPLLCPSFVAADISLGVMRNGIGSMSTEDIWVVVADKRDEELLLGAQKSGKIVKLKYDSLRFAICVPDRQLTSAEVQE